MNLTNALAKSVGKCKSLQCDILIHTLFAVVVVPRCVDVSCMYFLLDVTTKYPYIISMDY